MKLLPSCFLFVALTSAMAAQDKTRIFIDGTMTIRLFSSDSLMMTETKEEASDYAGDFFLELEECDDLLLARRFSDSDYHFQIGGLLNWHPGEEPYNQNFKFPYGIVRGVARITIWDFTDRNKPAVMESIEVGSLFLSEDVGILPLIKDVVKGACEEMAEEG